MRDGNSVDVCVTSEKASFRTLMVGDWSVKDGKVLLLTFFVILETEVKLLCLIINM